MEKLIKVSKYFMDEYEEDIDVSYFKLRELLLAKKYEVDDKYYIFKDGLYDYEVLTKDFDFYFKNREVK